MHKNWIVTLIWRECKFAGRGHKMGSIKHLMAYKIFNSRHAYIPMVFGSEYTCILVLGIREATPPILRHSILTALTATPTSPFGRDTSFKVVNYQNIKGCSVSWLTQEKQCVGFKANILWQHKPYFLSVHHLPEAFLCVNCIAFKKWCDTFFTFQAEALVLICLMKMTF